MAPYKSCFSYTTTTICFHLRELVDTLLHADGLVSNLAHLVWSKRHFVLRICSEWQRINWELWVLLMENVCLTVLPVREIHLVARCQLHGSLVEWLVKIDQISTSTLLSVMDESLSGVHIHFVRVNNFCFFFHVEGFFVVLGKCILSLKFFLVGGVGLGWVGVSHETVVATHASAIQVVPGRHLFNCQTKVTTKFSCELKHLHGPWVLN